MIKSCGVVAFDEFLGEEIPNLISSENAVVFWDVDAPATLSRMENDPNYAFREQVSRYDCIFTYGGGDPVVRAYLNFGAKQCVPIYNALDEGTDIPEKPQKERRSSLSFVGNSLPGREHSVLEFSTKTAGA